MLGSDRDGSESGSAKSEPRSFGLSGLSNDRHSTSPAHRASGPSQVKDRPRGHVGHTDEELAEMRKYDLKRVKRIMANRSSAARSKVRKLRYTNELDSRITALSNEQRGLQEEFYAVQANIASLSKENDFLCDEIRKLHDDVSQANTRSIELKERAHLLRMQVLYGPLSNGPLSIPSQPALQNLQAAAGREAALTLQAPPRAMASPSTRDALLSFSSAHAGPGATVLNLNSQGSIGGNLPIPNDLPVASRLAGPLPSPFNAPQLWSNALSSSSTGSAFSGQPHGRSLVTDRQLTADDPLLLNMLQSIDLASDRTMTARPSDISSQSAQLINSGSSWNPRPALSQLMSTRSSLGSLPADPGAWNIPSFSSATAENASLLPFLAEQKQQYRRSAGDFPLGLPEPLQGLARFTRHFSEPRNQDLPEVSSHMSGRQR